LHTLNSLLPGDTQCSARAGPSALKPRRRVGFRCRQRRARRDR
jgi:hypothetical protein